MKLKVGVLFGGRSGEHEVSVMSAMSVMSAIDSERFEVIPVGITGKGQWLLPEHGDLENIRDRGKVEEDCGVHVILAPEPTGGALYGPGMEEASQIDLFFPVLHGTFGEDGTVQGLLEMASVPYVGGGVLASSAGMDKIVMKSLFKQRGIPVPDYLPVSRRAWRQDPKSVIMQAEDIFGSYPLFVKPANLGSSVGITKVKEPGQMDKALEIAFRYDLKAIVERAVKGREIECSVLGNDAPIASLPGEIVPSREFYDYHAKYIDGRSQLIIPAPLEPGVSDRVRELALESFLAIDCSGMARVDFFVEDDVVLVNEINTIPGFTSISMYPKMWEASGIGYTELLSRLLDLAVERFEEKSSLVTDFDPREDSPPGQ